MYSSEVNAEMKLDFFALKHHGRDSVNGHTVGTLGDSDSNINQEVLIDENNEGTDVFIIYEFYWNDPTNDNPPMFFWDFLYSIQDINLLQTGTCDAFNLANMVADESGLSNYMS